MDQSLEVWEDEGGALRRAASAMPPFAPLARAARIAVRWSAIALTLAILYTATLY